MNLTITGKGIELTDGIKNAVEDALTKFDKFFTDETKVTVVCKVQKNQQIVEITIPIRGNVVRVEEARKDLYEAIDCATDKLDRQIKKFRTKIRDKKLKAIVREDSKYDFRDDIVDNTVDEPDEIKIVKNKTFNLTKMKPEEACEELEALSHNFFVFINEINNKFAVVYKRYDGAYGMIEGEG